MMSVYTHTHHTHCVCVHLVCMVWWRPPSSRNSSCSSMQGLVSGDRCGEVLLQHAGMWNWLWMKNYFIIDISHPLSEHYIFCQCSPVKSKEPIQKMFVLSFIKYINEANPCCQVPRSCGKPSQRSEGYYSSKLMSMKYLTITYRSNIWS